MKVSVTQADIDNGFRCDAGVCPVALAMERAFGMAMVVGTNRARSLYSGLRVYLPDEVIAFIYAFDHEEPVEPFEFELDWPGVG